MGAAAPEGQQLLPPWCPQDTLWSLPEPPCLHWSHFVLPSKTRPRSPNTHTFLALPLKVSLSELQAVKTGPKHTLSFFLGPGYAPCLRCSPSLFPRGLAQSTHAAPSNQMGCHLSLTQRPGTLASPSRQCLSSRDFHCNRRAGARREQDRDILYHSGLNPLQHLALCLALSRLLSQNCFLL